MSLKLKCYKLKRFYWTHPKAFWDVPTQLTTWSVKYGLTCRVLMNRDREDIEGDAVSIVDFTLGH